VNSAGTNPQHKRHSLLSHTAVWTLLKDGTLNSDNGFHMNICHTALFETIFPAESSPSLHGACWFTALGISPLQCSAVLLDCVD
jgi:hypothetical protein